MVDNPQTTPQIDNLDIRSGKLDLVTRQHAMQVISIVGAHGPVRYGDIEEQLGDASSSTISSRLDELVDANLLGRESYDEVPPRVEYELTATGEELEERVTPLLEWLGE